MRGKKRAGDEPGKKAVVPAQGGRAAKRKGAAKAPARQPARARSGRASKTTLAAGAAWPFPTAAWPDLKDEDRDRPTPIVDAILKKVEAELSQNGLPKRLRRA